MGRLVRFLLFALHYQIVASSSVVIARTPCPTDQSQLLLQFKQSVSITADASAFCDVPSYPKMVSWNTSRDCCSWDGVTCEELTGQVIGLDVSCGQIQGAIESNSSLFQLSHLRNLNLAYNDFSSSSIPSNFSRLGSLTDLNLSQSGFTGQLPPEILRLSNLITLDLSSCSELTIQPTVFRSLLQNSTKLRQVLLDTINIASVMPRNLSSSFTILALSSTGLYGNLSMVKWSSSCALTYLDLSANYFSEDVPQSFGNFQSLSYLDLSESQFSGTIPESLGNLSQITHLNLHSNNFSGQLPSSLANLDQLIYLDLSRNSLEGQLPNFFSNFTSLTTLILGSNVFVGCFPSSVINLPQLHENTFEFRITDSIDMRVRVQYK